MEKIRSNKDGASIKIEKVDGKKIYTLTISDGKNSTSLTVNKAQAKGILNDLAKILEA